MIWLSPRKAAQYIKEKDSQTTITEWSIRKLVKNGFPCIVLSGRIYIDMETFDRDLTEYFGRNGKTNRFYVRKPNSVVFRPVEL